MASTLIPVPATSAAALSITDALGIPVGNLALSVSGGTYTLSATEAANISFDISGILASNQIIEVPAGIPADHEYIFDNLTTGAFTLTIKVVGGAVSTVVPQGNRQLGYSNGLEYEALSTVAASGPVISVFGRAGVIVAAAGDYTAGLVTNTPAGNIAATDVQAAINELDTEKIPVTQKAAANGVASLDANTEVVQLPAGAAAANADTVLRADGTWFRPGTHDLVSLSASFTPASTNTWLNVTGWTALQLSNFTYSAGVFTCAVTGRYRIIFNSEPYNAAGVIVSAFARLNFSTAGSLATRSYTFLGTTGAYGGLPQSEAIIDFAVSDTFSPQYYVTSVGCYLQTSTDLIIEAL